MQTRHVLKMLLPLGLLVGLAVANCTGNMAAGDRDYTGWDQQSPACDPDGYAPCPDDWFMCVEDDAGNKHCEGQNPAVPGAGDWECYEEGTTLVCRGDQMPSDDGFWDCEQLGDQVICRGHAYVPNDDGGEGNWNCWYEGEFRICESGDGDWDDGDDTPGEDGGGSSSDGDGVDWWDDWFPDGMDEDWVDGIEDWFDDLFTPDEPGDEPPDEGGGEDDCVCIPGAWRYCDTPTYCRWGIQHCNDDSMSWGACVETSIPTECTAVDSWYSPEAEACCIDAGFCCQDMWDRDRDGNTWESLGDCTDIECV